MHKTYELVVLLHPDLEIDVEAPIQKVEGLIEAAGGKVIKRDNWGKKRLAYRIKRQDFAIYVYFEIQLDPTRVRGLEDTILITEEVVRHLLVVHEENAKSAKKSGKTGEAEAKEADAKEVKEEVAEVAEETVS
jgi:small subunit ribosomal protein S6